MDGLAGETFLRRAALKAGLLPEAWQDPPSEMYLFLADIFSKQGARPP